MLMRRLGLGDALAARLAGDPARWFGRISPQAAPPHAEAPIPGSPAPTSTPSRSGAPGGSCDPNPLRNCDLWLSRLSTKFGASFTANTYLVTSANGSILYATGSAAEYRSSGE